MSIVTVTERGPISIIAINRPDRLNAISSGVAKELQAAFQAFDASDQRVAIYTAEGTRAFTAGADVNDLPELWRCIPTVGFKTEKPVIGAMSGWCVGGGVVIATMCDLLVCSESTQFYYPEAKLGLTGGLIATLAGRMPHKLAMEVMLLGSKIPARRAYDVGFVNRVTPEGHHLDEAMAMAEALLEAAPLVAATLKRFVNDHILPKGPVEHLVATSQAIAQVRSSADMQEGLAAFREKRKPVFKGK